MLDFQTWEYINQKEVTQEMRKRALRCHHLYDIKRDLSAKNKVVVNGSRQHVDTYTDTTFPSHLNFKLGSFSVFPPSENMNLLNSTPPTPT
jgi:hypothetical protein